MPETVGDQDPPVPVVLGVRLSVACHQQHGGLDIASLVEDPQIELEIGPVVWQRIDDLLEGGAEGHAASKRTGPSLPADASDRSVWQACPAERQLNSC